MMDEKRIEHDLPCIECGYNLRTLRRDASCPECGRSVRESVENMPWWCKDIAHLKHLTFWFNWLMVAALLGVGLPLLIGLAFDHYLFTYRRNVGLIDVLIWFCLGVPFILHSLSLWKFATAGPHGERGWLQRLDWRCALGGLMGLRIFLWLMLIVFYYAYSDHSSPMVIVGIRRHLPSASDIWMVAGIFEWFVWQAWLLVGVVHFKLMRKTKRLLLATFTIGLLFGASLVVGSMRYSYRPHLYIELSEMAMTLFGVGYFVMQVICLGLVLKQLMTWSHKMQLD